MRRHDESLSPVLRYIQHHVQLGVTDADWYEEQFEYLLGRMIRNELRLQSLPERVSCKVRCATNFPSNPYVHA